MKGDFSRFTFDPKKRTTGVRLQQGRVQLDADWNEQLDVATHLRRMVTVDLMGRSGAPLEGGGFEVRFAGGDLRLSPGRYYADGVLCENDAEVAFTTQPELPGQSLPQTDGLYLAYLDVWERHVTALEDPDLLEPALGGADTATRTRTVWQLRLAKVADDFDVTDVGPGWRPPGTEPLPTLAARGTGAVQENRLYRVEIHTAPALPVDPGSPPLAVEPTFKWSRDNGAAAARIENPRLRDLVITARIDQDPVGGFAAGQWIEVTDEDLILRGEPGIFARLAAVSGQTLTVEEWPGDTPALPNRPVVRRWDSGELVVGPGPAGSDGWIELEDGVEIHFGTPSAAYRTGDYWLIPARARAGVLWPDAGGTSAFQPPHGIERHVAPLALVRRLGGSWSVEGSCRRSFRPVTDQAGEKVSVEGDEMTGPLTVREASFRVIIDGVPSLRVSELGRVGIGVDEPEAALEVAGAIKLRAGTTRQQTLLFHRASESIAAPPIDDGFRLRYDNDFLGANLDALVIEKTDNGSLEPDGGIVFANTGSDGIARPALTVRGTGNVGIGTTVPQARLQVAGGAIMPAAGNGESAGILFPRDPFGGAGDRAWIRYYPRSGEATTFEIGTSNDGDDHIALMPGAGNVGIGTAAPQAKLQVVGGAIMPAAGPGEDAGILFPRDPFGGGGDRAWIRYYTRGGESTVFAIGTNNDWDDHIALLPERGNVGVRTDNPQYTLDVAGHIRGAFTFFSDARLKEQIEPITGALEKVCALRGVSFNWRPEIGVARGLGTGRQLGLLGQEVEAVLPELVMTDGEGHKNVEYANLVAVLVEAIKSLETKVRELEARLAAREPAPEGA